MTVAELLAVPRKWVVYYKPDPDDVVKRYISDMITPEGCEGSEFPEFTSNPAKAFPGTLEEAQKLRQQASWTCLEDLALEELP